MAETIARTTGFEGLAPITARSRLTIEPAPPAARFVLRGDDQAAALAGEGLGLALPAELNRAASGEGRAAFKLGPDEWLMIMPEGESTAFAARLTSASVPLSLVDVGERNVALILTGLLAPEVLASGMPLDLDPAAFPVGMATRTVFHKAEIVLWREAETRFRLELWRSFAPYVHGQLAEAAREYQK